MIGRNGTLGTPIKQDKLATLTSVPAVTEINSAADLLVLRSSPSEAPKESLAMGNLTYDSGSVSFPSTIRTFLLT